MTINEQIKWKNCDVEMPDCDTVVLVSYDNGHDAGVWPAYLDSDCWRLLDEAWVKLDDVFYWAELPKGPRAPDPNA